MDITVPVTRSIFGRSENDRRRKRFTDLILEKENSQNHLWLFKIRPEHEPLSSETRPLAKNCTNCLSTAEFRVLDDIKHYGLMDCLRLGSPTNVTIPATNNNNYKQKRLASVAVVNPYNQLPTWKELENDPELFSLYSQETVKSPSFLETTKKEILETLSLLQVRQIPSFLFAQFLRLSLWLTRKYLACFFEEILIHEGHIEMLKDLQEQKLPIVYIPTYRSSLDKTLILWVMAKHGLKAPLFIPAYKDNPSLSKYFGGIGASLKNLAFTISDDLKYSSAVASYLRNLVRKKNSIILQLAASRTISGRPSAQLYGTEFIRIILDQHKSNKIEDAYFVPMSVSYELLPDAQDLQRSSTSLISTMINILLTFLGRGSSQPKCKVRIDFSQPICLRGLDQSLKEKVCNILVKNPDYANSFGKSRDCSYLRWDPMESLDVVSPLYGIVAPLYPADDSEKTNVRLDIMGLHFLYDAGRCESIMPTHLLAFLMTKKFKQGVFMNQLLPQMDWLVEFIKSIKKDFGFDFLGCDTEAIIMRGIKMLRNDLVVDWDDEKKIYKISPKLEMQHMERLEYYANFILPEFMMEGIIATAVFATFGTQFTVLRGFDVELQIDFETFFHKCMQVYKCFTSGFLLHPPCLSSYAALKIELERMASLGEITLIQRENKTYAWEDNYSDSDDYCATEDKKTELIDLEFTYKPEFVKVLTSQETYERLNFSRSLVVPYLEIYAFLMGELKVLISVEGDEKKMEWKKLENLLYDKLLLEMNRDFKQFRELLGKNIVKEFLVFCEDQLIIFPRPGPTASIRYYVLDDMYVLDDGQELDKEANEILNFVTI